MRSLPWLEQYGANPIKKDLMNCLGRPLALESAWLHALDTIAQQDVAIDIVLAMQATSPDKSGR